MHRRALAAILAGTLVFGGLLAGCAHGNTPVGGTAASAAADRLEASDSPVAAAPDTGKNANTRSVFTSRISVEHIRDIPSEEGVFAFATTAQHTAPDVPESNLSAIEQACDDITLYGADLGFLFIDLNTGNGIGRNIDTPIFGASAIKGIYAAYLCEGLVDTGVAAWSDMCSENAAYPFLMEDAYLFDDASEYPLDALLSDAILHSDNDAYRILRMNYDGQAYADWLDAAGVDGGDWRFTDWWTVYSARESALLWLQIENYITSDAPSSRKLWSLLASTEVSFIRNTLADAHEHNYLSIDKAGWNADIEQLQFNALGDAGIVSQGDTSYLVVVLSSYPGEEDTFYLAENLIAALWNARGALA